MSAQLSSVSCVISYFYIKPQLMREFSVRIIVVLYLTSTSNHNDWVNHETGKSVVLYLTSTSNHNCVQPLLSCTKLCYILLLHQTTTSFRRINESDLLCYILLLHQTTTRKCGLKKSDGLCYILLLHQTTTYMR